MSECRADTYVGCPPPTVDLPDCEDGWEFGNGTAVCATVQPPAALPATGIDPGAAVGFTLLGVVLIGSSIVMLVRERRRQR